MEKWMKNGTFGEKRWKNGRKNGRKTALFFTKIQSPVSGVEKWGKIEVSGGLQKIGDFIGLCHMCMRPRLLGAYCDRIQSLEPVVPCHAPEWGTNHLQGSEHQPCLTINPVSRLS